MVRNSVTAFAILLLGVHLAIPLVWAQGYLYDRAGFGTGNHPAGIIVGDFNHDRRLDLAVTNLDDNTVSILLGTRGGT